MTLSVEVETGRRERALVVPLSALRSQASSPNATATVLVASAGRAQERQVRLGLRTLDAAEVTEGLAEGDAVLLGGGVAAGARIRARAVAWAPGQAVTRAAATSEAGSAMSNAMGR